MKSLSRFASALLFLLISLPAMSNHKDPSYNFLTVTIENDIFAGKDGGYTNGTGVSWAHSDIEHFTEDNLPDWIYALGKDLYINTMPGKVRAVSYMIAQGMYTPSDITRKNLIPDEAPYAGITLWQVNLHAFDHEIADKVSLAIGVVGPASGAKAAQKFIHRITGSENPQGWDNQIHNEIVFHVQAERLWRLADISFGYTGFDLIGTGAVGLGTLSSDIATGLSIRYGHGLDRNFATATILPGREINPLAGSKTSTWSVFANVLAMGVANDISVNGNTFQDSHSVPLRHLQGQFVIGAAFSIGHWAFLLSAVSGSDTYEGQAISPRFGSLSITYNN